MTPARFRWGIILIAIGTLLLLRNMNLLTDDFWLELLIWLPVVLIAIGIEKIFTKTRLQFIAYLTSLALFAGALTLAFMIGGHGHLGGYFSSSTHMIEFDDKVRLIKADLDLSETNLTIRDSGDDLVYGSFDRFTRKPRIDYELLEDTARIVYRARSGSYLGGAIKVHTDESQDWYLRFNQDVPLHLSCQGEDADLHMNLSTTPVRVLELDADDATVYLKLGDLEPSVLVKVQGDGTTLKLRLPERIGLMVRGAEYKNYLERIGLKSRDGLFVSDGYDTLPSRIDLELDDRLASFSVDFF